MAIGPVQLIAIGFEPTDRVQGRIRRELQELDGRGIIRIIDMLMVKKDVHGTLTPLEDAQPAHAEFGSAGQVLSVLIGLDTDDTAIRPGTDSSGIGRSRMSSSGKASCCICVRISPGSTQ